METITEEFFSRVEQAVMSMKSLSNEQVELIAQRAIDSLTKTIGSGQEKIIDAAISNFFQFEENVRNMEPETLEKTMSFLADQLCDAFDDALVSVETAQETIDEVTPYIPTNVTESIRCKIEKSKTSNNEIPRSDWIAIIGIIVTVLLFVAGQVASNKHEQNEEALWAATAEYQQESLELQRRDVELKQEFLDYLQNLQSDSVEVRDVAENISNAEQHIQELVDSQNISESCDTLQKQSDRQP